jgi:hypothetical protein
VGLLDPITEQVVVGVAAGQRAVERDDLVVMSLGQYADNGRLLGVLGELADGAERGDRPNLPGSPHDRQAPGKLRRQGLGRVDKRLAVRAAERGGGLEVRRGCLEGGLVRTEIDQPEARGHDQQRDRERPQ